MSDALTKVIKAGFGRQGYCKLCSLDDPKVQDELDRRVGAAREVDGEIRYEYTPKAINKWLKEKTVDISASRQTVYNHREHVMNPQDRAVTAIRKRQLDHGTQPKVTSEQAFLDAVIAMGHQNAIDDPTAITVDQALKATQIKQTAKSKGDAHQTLVAIFTGNYEPAIEGESKEL